MDIYWSTGNGNGNGNGDLCVFHVKINNNNNTNTKQQNIKMHKMTTFYSVLYFVIFFFLSHICCCHYNMIDGIFIGLFRACLFVKYWKWKC